MLIATRVSVNHVSGKTYQTYPYLICFHEVQKYTSTSLSASVLCSGCLDAHYDTSITIIRLAVVSEFSCDEGIICPKLLQSYYFDYHVTLF
jgi:hypothetical protein